MKRVIPPEIREKIRRERELERFRWQYIDGPEPLRLCELEFERRFREEKPYFWEVLTDAYTEEE